jgi:hypothetical protein
VILPHQAFFSSDSALASPIGGLGLCAKNRHGNDIPLIEVAKNEVPVDRI